MKYKYRDYDWSTPYDVFQTVRRALANSSLNEPPRQQKRKVGYFPIVTVRAWLAKALTRV